MTVNNFKISEDGINLIKDFEGCKLVAYQDQADVWTIGYGCTGSDVVSGLTITQDEAEQRLKDKLEEFENFINEHVTVKITQEMFDALSDFTYNLGDDHFEGSTLLKYINSEKFLEAADQFLLWMHVNGKISSGLKRRRKTERELFLTGVKLLQPATNEQPTETET